MPCEGPIASTSRVRPALTPSCETCRLRKIRCQRPEGSELDTTVPCQGCVRKGIQCVFVDRPRTRNRSGKNVEAARARYGALTPSSGSGSSHQSGSVTPPLLPVQDALVRQELAGAVGFRLLESWLDQAQERTSVPNLDPPVIDFWALLDRYYAVGQKLEHLMPLDQLQCRIVYATAAPIHLPDRIAGETRRTVARQLRQDAESMADGLAIWRKPDPRHVAPLMLLYKTFSTEDNKNDDAVPYLAAAISHCRVLAGRDRSSSTVTAGGATINVSWTLIIMDVLSSMERRRKPHLSRDEVTEFLGEDRASLPILEDLRLTIGQNAEAAMTLVMQAVSTLMLIAYDVDAVSAAPDCHVQTFHALWQRLDAVYAWCQHTTEVNASPSHGGGRLFWLYGSLLWATSIMIELSLVEIITALIATAASPSSRSSGWPNTSRLSELVALSALAQRRVAARLCAYLPHTYGTLRREPLYTLATMSGATCSVARVLDMAQTLARTSCDDPELFPFGAYDRSAALDHVLVQVRRLAVGYPGPKMDATVALLEEEQRKMQVALATATSADMGASFAQSSSSAESSYMTPSGALISLSLDNLQYDALPPQVAHEAQDLLFPPIDESALAFLTSAQVTDVWDGQMV